MTTITGSPPFKRIDVRLKPDTLNEENRKFVQQPLKAPLFLNSVPKCGSHLLRNIIRMFVPVEQQYDVQFIQHQMLNEHLGAFADPRNFLSWGHLLFNDKTGVAVGSMRHVLLVRDPYDWVIARARFFLSDEFKGFELLKEGTLSLDALFNMMIFGIQEKAPPLAATFSYNAVAWLGTGAHLVRYEDLLAAVKDIDGEAADRFFAELLNACGIERPDDWRERVRIGSDRKQSGTARENLTGVEVEFPSELPELQKRMVDMVAPGLRALLGYE
ncbi:MAG TPA: hypothetical protein VIV07_09600 [Sphingomicrobium sp.]